jgi:CBS domain-containing protein
MRVRDAMSANVISVAAQATILEAARTMLRNRVSGLPVVDAEGQLVGMVTEGDFLRRSEIGTERRRPRWLEFVLGPGRMAEDYVRAAGRKVEDVMTRDPVTVREDDDLETVVELMERRRVKRFPVLRDGKMVGIVSRANLMRALVSLAPTEEAPAGGDPAIRELIVAAFAKQPWAPHRGTMDFAKSRPNSAKCSAAVPAEKSSPISAFPPGNCRSSSGSCARSRHVMSSRSAYSPGSRMFLPRSKAAAFR